ncbi:hypothetical protein DBR32_05130 [Taibaiella sp. KBW10]|uniref:hypothetical protein n=1 Tax=Taibaiella sp. KBW10 TaxID=2153357 RepID=UPI000F59441D|nr:hypothetical protein [Taibaiella sp. KBW10]RQO31348.1 hypothetical protein DBR32_05130 [Taibaiella sp. KBW10]
MRNIFKVVVTLAAGSVLMLTSCTKETQAPFDNSNYLPLQKGKYILYDVDSIVHNDFNNTSISYRSQMRYDVVDSFYDNQNRLTYTVNVMWRRNSADAFIPKDVIQVTKTKTAVEWVQTNVRLTKMVFPVVEGTAWNGNSFVSTLDPQLDEYQVDKYGWNYKYANVGSSFDPGNNPFYNTVTVNEVDASTNTPNGDVYADRNYSQEIYAYGIGLVYKERIYWTYQPNKYKKGYEVVMRAVDQN